MTEDPGLPAGQPARATAASTEPAPVDIGYLTSGSSHPFVVELGRALETLGFPNSASRGENPYGALDTSVMAAVHAFRSKFAVVEPPADVFGGATPAGEAIASNHLGPQTMTAIIREAARALEHAVA